MAAVVFKDAIPECDKLYKIAGKGLSQWFGYRGNPLKCKPQNFDNGAFYEGVDYLNYPLREFLQFAFAQLRLTGTKPFDDGTILRKNGEFLVNCSYLTETKDFHIDFRDTAGYGVIDSVFYLIRYGIITPELCWYAKNTVGENLITLLISESLAQKAFEPPKKLSVCYDKTGWAIFRDTFEKNGKMLAIKCGDTWNHAHADCAHFTLFENGKKTIYDFLKPSTYSKKTYIDYYVESKAHNVLLFNGKGQDMRDNAHCPGKLLNYTDDRGFKYVVADGTGPMSRYLRKHHRHFIWLNNFILIYDDIECYENGKVSFLLHAAPEVRFKMLTNVEIEEHIG